jgi:hypothetical protein
MNMKAIIKVFAVMLVFFAVLIAMAEPANADIDWLLPPTVTDPTDSTTSTHKPSAGEMVDLHFHVYQNVGDEPTCTADAQGQFVCVCGDSYIKTLAATGHSYSSWKVTKSATPTKDGTESRSCHYCGDKQTRSIEFKYAGSNAIYIRSAGLNVRLNHGEFDQDSVDKYDVVIAYPTYCKGAFVLGHKTRSMKVLHKTKIGDIIYLRIDGNVTRYKVIISEYAFQNKEQNDIVGQTTGISMWDESHGDTLHLYTCHGSNKDGRWLVLAVKI